MEPELFTMLMQQLQSIDFQGRISYHFYGEPLLCSNLDLFVQMTRSYLPEARPVLYTNGDFLTVERVQQLLGYGVQKLIVTQHVGPQHLFHKVVPLLTEEQRSRIEYLQHDQLVLSNRGGLLGNIPNQLGVQTPCYVPSTLVVVSVQGNVVPCFEDYEQKIPMGNIREQHIRDIWQSDAYEEFRQSLRQGHRAKYEICKFCNNASVQDDTQYDFVL